MSSNSISLVKDRKGPCWIISHKRAGITESIFLTEEEIKELKTIIYDKGI